MSQRLEIILYVDLKLYHWALKYTFVLYCVMYTVLYCLYYKKFPAFLPAWTESSFVLHSWLHMDNDGLFNGLFSLPKIKRLTKLKLICVMYSPYW